MNENGLFNNRKRQRVGEIDIFFDQLNDHIVSAFGYIAHNHGQIGIIGTGERFGIGKYHIVRGDGRAIPKSVLGI